MGCRSTEIEIKLSELGIADDVPQRLTDEPHLT